MLLLLCTTIVDGGLLLIAVVVSRGSLQSVLLLMLSYRESIVIFLVVARLKATVVACVVAVAVGAASSALLCCLVLWRCENLIFGMSDFLYYCEQQLPCFHLFIHLLEHYISGNKGRTTLFLKMLCWAIAIPGQLLNNCAHNTVIKKDTPIINFSRLHSPP